MTPAPSVAALSAEQPQKQGPQEHPVAEKPTSVAEPAAKPAHSGLSFRKNPLRFSWAFAKEIFGEHEFWLNTIAVRGGAGAIVAGAAVGLGLTVGLPVAATAIVVAGLGVMASLAIYCIAAGGMQAWQGVKRAYHRACGRPPQEEPPVAVKTLQQRLAERPLIKKWMASKAGQEVVKSRAWKIAKKITQEENLVGGMAIGGSVLALAIGIPLLATQIVVLPVVAVGTVLTGGMVMAVSSISSGLTGLYFSITGLRHQLHRKREEAAERKAQKKEKEAAASSLPTSTLPPSGGLTTAFEKVQTAQTQGAAGAEPDPAQASQLTRPPASGQPVASPAL